jgi:hypothetical protein
LLGKKISRDFFEKKISAKFLVNEIVNARWEKLPHDGNRQRTCPDPGGLLRKVVTEKRDVLTKSQHKGLDVASRS